MNINGGPVIQFFIMNAVMKNGISPLPKNISTLSHADLSLMAHLVSLSELWISSTVSASIGDTGSLYGDRVLNAGRPWPILKISAGWSTWTAISSSRASCCKLRWLR
ncbi:hypothetical protein QEM11_004178 [Pseudomonas putida]|nr:hypothetical protein [Pseudomonas putida]